MNSSSTLTKPSPSQVAQRPLPTLNEVAGFAVPTVQGAQLHHIADQALGGGALLAVPGRRPGGHSTLADGERVVWHQRALAPARHRCCALALGPCAYP